MIHLNNKELFITNYKRCITNSGLAGVRNGSRFVAEHGLTLSEEQIHSFEEVVTATAQTTSEEAYVDS